MKLKHSRKKTAKQTGDYSEDIVIPLYCRYVLLMDGVTAFCSFAHSAWMETSDLR